MSLTLNTNSIPSWNVCEDGEDERASRLDSYLALMETNKQACEFVPNDALLALDMVGFVSSRIGGALKTSRVSTARLALSLVRPGENNPVQ